MAQTLDPREIAFRQFWAAYPRRVAVAEARVAFARAIQSTPVADIIEGAGRFARDKNRTDTYTPFPAKWLDRCGWEEGPLPPRTYTPQEQIEREIMLNQDRDKRERLKSEQIAREFEEAKARAVPLDPDLKKSTLDIIQRNLYPETND